MTTTRDVHKPIAIRLTIDPRNRLAQWQDTGRGHLVYFKEYAYDEKTITMISTDDHKWTFVPLTCQIFKNIQSRLVYIDKPLTTDDELQKYYAETNF